MMTSEITIVCDGCGKHITTTKSTPAFRLALSVEKIPHYFGEGGVGSVDIVKRSIPIYPPLKYTHHFCDLICLDEWSLDKNE